MNAPRITGRTRTQILGESVGNKRDKINNIGLHMSVEQNDDSVILQQDIDGGQEKHTVSGNTSYKYIL